jgi:hypothetical protein
MKQRLQKLYNYIISFILILIACTLHDNKLVKIKVEYKKITDSDIKLFQADENETSASQECRRRLLSQELLRLFPETERRRQPPQELRRRRLLQLQTVLQESRPGVDVIKLFLPVIYEFS